MAMGVVVVNQNTKGLKVDLEEKIANLCPKKYVVKSQSLTVVRLLIQHADKLLRAYVERFRENNVTKSRDIIASRYDSKPI